MVGMHVVIGGSGGAGSAIAAHLVERGLETRVVSRSGAGPEGAESRRADITSAEMTRNAVEGATHVYMAAQPPYASWATAFPGMLDSVIDATADTGARLVMVDNLYMYGPGHTSLSEATEPNARDRKGRARRAMAETLLRANEEGRLEVVIGRSSDYIGSKEAVSTITELALKPLQDGGPIRWMGSAKVPHSIAYLPDIARAFVELALRPDAVGQVWHMPHLGAPTGAEFLALVENGYGHALKKGVITRTMLYAAAPFQSMVRQLVPISYQWTQPWVVDDSKFHSAFPEFETTSMEEAVAATVEAWQIRD